MSKIDLTTHERFELAMENTTQRRHFFRDLLLIRQAADASQVEIAKAIGVRTRQVKRFEENPEEADPTVDFVLRYAHAIGARVGMTAVPLHELPEELS